MRPFPTVNLFGAVVPIGGVVGVEVSSRLGRIDHRGIVSDAYGPDGQPTIVHASNLLGKIVEESATDFMRKAVGPIRSLGFWGELPPGEVLRRARAQLGQPYRLLRRNCEHLVAQVHGLAPISPQLRSAVGGAALTATMATTGLLAAARLAR